MPNLIITVEFTDDSDYDWLRTKMVAAVEEVAADQADEGRVDGKVDVSWEVDFQ